MNVSEHKGVLFSLIPVEQPVMSFPGALSTDLKTSCKLNWSGWDMWSINIRVAEAWKQTMWGWVYDTDAISSSSRIAWSYEMEPAGLYKCYIV